MKLTYTLPILLLISTCTQATMFAGDILGRDLTLKYPIGGVAQVGHVGVWNGQQVVEVLNEFPAIKFNSFANFINRYPSYFWGARGNARFNNSNNINGLANNQSQYYPSYTLIPIFTQVGKMDFRCANYSIGGSCSKYEYVPIQAVFRCDTFVNFLYYNTGNGNLADYNVIAPRMVYVSRPIQR